MTWWNMVDRRTIEIAAMALAGCGSPHGKAPTPRPSSTVSITTPPVPSPAVSAAPTVATPSGPTCVLAANEQVKELGDLPRPLRGVYGGDEVCVIDATETTWCGPARKGPLTRQPHGRPHTVRVTDGGHCALLEGHRASCSLAMVGSSARCRLLIEDVRDIALARVPAVSEEDYGKHGNVYLCTVGLNGVTRCYDGLFALRGDAALSESVRVEGPALQSVVLPTSYGLDRAGGVHRWFRSSAMGDSFVRFHLAPPPAPDLEPVPWVPKMTEVELPTEVLAIESGLDHACALDAHGKVRCWGDNLWRQLGALQPMTPRLSDGSARPWMARPPSLVTGLPPAKQLASGDDHACILDGEGRLWCWGKNDRGQLGHVANRCHPPSEAPGLPMTCHGPAVVPGVDAVVQVSAQGDTTTYLNEAGELGWLPAKTP